MNGEVLHKYWWAFVVRGVFSIFFAAAAFLRPTLTFEILILFFGAYAFVDGIFAIVAALNAAIHHKRWWLLVLEGLVGVAIGLVVYFRPANTMEFLILMVACWAFITGFFELLASFTAPWDTKGKILLGLAGMLSLILGFLMMKYPGLGVVYIIWLMGAYALIFGTALINLGFYLKRAPIKL